MGLKKIWANINIIRSLPSIFSYLVSKNKEIIDHDIEEWLRIQKLEHLRKKSKIISLNWLLVYSQEFRNLFYSRLRNVILVKILGLFYPKLGSLFINTKEIGEGLYICHGFSTIIVAKSIGDNCWINQQVTIGYRNKKNPPIIGNNVTIGAGAIVIGDIIIGDNSVIGAGAVVTKNVPENSVVIGNPAILLRKDGELVKQAL